MTMTNTIKAGCGTTKLQLRKCDSDLQFSFACTFKRIVFYWKYVLVTPRWPKIKAMQKHHSLFNTYVLNLTHNSSCGATNISGVGRSTHQNRNMCTNPDLCATAYPISCKRLQGLSFREAYSIWILKYPTVQSYLGQVLVHCKWN